MNTKRTKDSLIKLPKSKLERKRFLLNIFYVISIIIVATIVELYVYQKKDRLLQDMKNRNYSVLKSFTDNVSACIYKGSKDLEYEEIPLPKFPKEKGYEEQKQWKNIYSEASHIYKITKNHWTMQGYVRHGIPTNRDITWGKNGYLQYNYFPYIICVPKGVSFNRDIAYDILQQALDKMNSDIDGFRSVEDYFTTKNEYFIIQGTGYAQDNLKYICPFYDEITGCGPIFENNKFTGLYNFGLINISPYKVLLAFEPVFEWSITEKNSMWIEASRKDRLLADGFLFIILTTVYFVIKNKLSKKIRKEKLILTEPLGLRMIRYTNPQLFINSNNAELASCARDYNNELLEENIDNDKIIEIANSAKEKLNLQLISNDERTYLIYILNNKRKEINSKQKMINSLLVLITDVNKINGNEYNTIQDMLSNIFRIK